MNDPGISVYCQEPPKPKTTTTNPWYNTTTIHSKKDEDSFPFYILLFTIAVAVLFLAIILVCFLFIRSCCLNALNSPRSFENQAYMQNQRSHHQPRRQLPTASSFQPSQQFSNTSPAAPPPYSPTFRVDPYGHYSVNDELPTYEEAVTP